MNAVTVFIFLFTYALITSRRLSLLPIGRPAGAMLGALLMVAARVMSPAESFRAVDGATILLLFSMMLLTGYLDRSGVFAVISHLIVKAAGTPLGLLRLVALSAAAMSALLVNDTVCLIMTPLMVDTCRRHRLPMGPYLMALATSANIGSAATLVGNPQNMIIGSLSQIGFNPFLIRAGPAALAGLLVNTVLLGVYYRRRLPAGFPAPIAPLSRPTVASWLPVLAMVAVALGFLAGFDLGYTALAGAMVLLLSARKEPVEAFRRIDWTLLVFFASLFVVVEGLAKTGLPDRAWAAYGPYLRLDNGGGIAAFAAFMTAGCNVFSNVPMVLLSGPHLAELDTFMRGWVLLGFVTTVAGNLTLLGSVANIIVAEQSKLAYEL